MVSTRTRTGVAAGAWSGIPNGSAASRCADDGCLRLGGVLLGCTRTLSLARAYGETALTAPSTDGTSIPMTVIAAPDQTRSASGPCPRNGIPAHLRELAELVVGPRRALPRVSPQTLDRDVAVLVVRATRARGGARSAHPARRRRTGRSASRCRGSAPRRTTGASPRSRRSARGHPAGCPAVRDEHRVGAERLERRRRLEHASDLLLALDEDLDPDRGRSALPARSAPTCTRRFDFESQYPGRRSRRPAPSPANGGESQLATRHRPRRRRSDRRGERSVRPAARGSHR